LGAILARWQFCDSGHVRSLCRSIAIQMQRCAICVQNLANFAHKQEKYQVNTLQNNVLGMYRSTEVSPAGIFGQV
jgi:hypothetical protein